MAATSSSPSRLPVARSNPPQQAGATSGLPRLSRSINGGRPSSTSLSSSQTATAASQGRSPRQQSTGSPSRLPLSASHGSISSALPRPTSTTPTKSKPQTLQSRRKDSTSLLFEQVVGPDRAERPISHVSQSDEQQPDHSSDANERLQSSTRDLNGNASGHDQRQDSVNPPPLEPQSQLSEDEQHERELRAGMLRRLKEAFGSGVTEGVDEDILISMAIHPKQAMMSTSQSQKNGSKVPSINRSTSTVSFDKKKRGFFGFRRSKRAASNPRLSGVSSADIPPEPERVKVFGVALDQLPRGALCATSVGDQSHVLPLVVYKLVEDMYRRGLQSAKSFRVLGDRNRIDTLQRLFEKPPHFGDQIPLEEEATETITELFKTYLRELPDPVLDSRLWALFQNTCLVSSAPLDKRVGAAQSILRLIPKRNFSLFIYLVAFFINLSQVDDNSLTFRDLGDIFGASLLVPRAVSSTAPHKASSDYTGADRNITQEGVQGLEWLLANWGYICGAPIPMGPSAAGAALPTTETVDLPGERSPLPTSRRMSTHSQESDHLRHQTTSSLAGGEGFDAMQPPDSSFPESETEPQSDEDQDRTSKFDPSSELSRTLAFQATEDVSTHRWSDSIEEVEEPESEGEEDSRALHSDHKTSYRNEEDRPVADQSDPAGSQRPPSPMPDLSMLARLSETHLASPTRAAPLEKSESQYSQSTLQSPQPAPSQDQLSRNSFVSAREQASFDDPQGSIEQDRRRSLFEDTQLDHSFSPELPEYAASPIATWYEEPAAAKTTVITPLEGNFDQFRPIHSSASVEHTDDSDNEPLRIRTASPQLTRADAEAALSNQGTSTDSGLISELRDEIHQLKVLAATQDSRFHEERSQMALRHERLQQELSQSLASSEHHESRSRAMASDVDGLKLSLKSAEDALQSSQSELDKVQAEKGEFVQQIEELTKRLERSEKDRDGKTKDLDRLVRILANTAKERDLLDRKLKKVRKLVTSIESIDSMRSFDMAVSEEATTQQDHGGVEQRR